MSSVSKLAEQWLLLDKDPETRLEIETLLEVNDYVELGKRLEKRIAFGTAGLRSSMKAGFAHMNSLTVLQASQGLAEYIIRLKGPDKTPLSIAIGYDARHNSEKFARLAAAVFLQKGFTVLWFGRLVHTPMVPFAVRHYKASAGIMVTASHNPKNDNGYKVYWSNGCQIIPPHDIGIASCIEKVGEVLCWDDSLVGTDARVKVICPEAHRAYLAALGGISTSTRARSNNESAFTYTPMHGVGLPFMQDALASLGLSKHLMHVVEEQALPDPEFPTVPFPNPEEHGALELAMKTAEANGTTMILANDPDADRFAVAVRVSDGSWHQLTGNQLGVLLASHVLDTYSGGRSRLVMLASTVSSRMLSTMANKEGFVFRETLTGFKWLANVGQTLQSDGYNAAFAYEEAIGYMFPTVVWDKDGIAAASAFLTASRRWKTLGFSPWTKLQSLYEKYGYFEDANTYLISPSPEVTNAVFANIRRLNDGYRPERLGGQPIRRWRDLTLGFDTASADGKPDLPVDASAQMITCEMDNVVFTVRGSGTEPKIKLYIEGTGSSTEEAKRKANATLRLLLEEWFKPEDFGLRLAEG